MNCLKKLKNFRIPFCLLSFFTSYVDAKPVVAVSTGEENTCVLTETKLSCFGDNKYDQAGYLPVSNGKSLSVGGSHVCFIDDDGLWCFGNDVFGQTDVPIDLKNPREVSVTSLEFCYHLQC